MISSSYSFVFFAFSLPRFVYFFVVVRREREPRVKRERAACVCGLKAKLCQAQLECIASIKCGAHM